MSYKNELQEFLQKKGYKLPSYELIDSSGPSHKPSFEFRVSVTWVDGVKYVETGMGSNKKDAQQEAAKKMLSRLVGDGAADIQDFVESPQQSRYRTPPPRVTSSPADSTFMNQVRSPSGFKSELQTLLQRNGMPIPTYTHLKNSGPSHHPTFTVKLEILSRGHQVVWSTTAKGPTKQKAEYEVAKIALDHVNEIIQRDGDLFLLNSRRPKSPPRKYVAPEVDEDLVSQLPPGVDTVFIQADKEQETDKDLWLCMKLVNDKKLCTTIASHGQGETKRDAEREANLNLMHSIRALQVNTS